MKKKTIFFVVLGLILGMSGAYAQGSTEVAGGDFSLTVCDNNSNNAFDLGLDVVGSDLNTAGGTWHWVTEMTTSNLDGYTGESDARFLGIVDGVFATVGKAAGTYTFIYTATNNECLQPVGTKVIARIIIAETAKDVAHTRFLCAGEEGEVKLRDIISAALIDDAKFDVSNAYNMGEFANGLPELSGTSPDEVVKIPSDWVGTMILHYYNDVACSDMATITITVDRNPGDFTFNRSEVIYCASEIPEALSLGYLSGTSAQNANGVGTWTVKSTTSGATVTTAGNVQFTDDFTTIGLPKSYIFVYTYDAGCDGNSDDTQEFTITVTDNLDTLTDDTDNICKDDNPTRVYDLMKDGLGLGIENNAGTWTIEGQPDGNVGLDVSDGLFRIKDAKIGEYKFLFKPSSAADVCGLDGTSLLTIALGDVSGAAVSDGRLKLCIDHVTSATATGNLKLSDYISGIGKVQDVQWSAPGTVVTTGTDNDEVAIKGTTGIESLGVGTHKFTFSYTSAGCDASTQQGEGYLYITVTSYVNMGDVELDYCRPDLPDGGINLYQALGVYMPGTWSIDATAAVNDAVADNLSEAVFTEGDVSGEKTYVFKFTPTEGYCELTPVTVTIIVRDESYN